MPTADQSHTTPGLLRSTAMRGRALLPALAPRSVGLLRPQAAPQPGPVTLAIAARGNLAEDDAAEGGTITVPPFEASEGMCVTLIPSPEWAAAGAELALGLRALLEEAGAA